LHRDACTSFPTLSHYLRQTPPLHCRDHDTRVGEFLPLKRQPIPDMTVCPSHCFNGMIAFSLLTDISDVCCRCSGYILDLKHDATLLMVQLPCSLLLLFGPPTACFV
jgi:hypothetical protein